MVTVGRKSPLREGYRERYARLVATNKNQHFVPRCYLKAFTQGGENLAINLLNLDRQRTIPAAPVNNW